MKFNLRKTFNLIGSNLLLTLGFLLVPELILSRYFLSSEAFNIPETLVNYRKIYDVKKIENDSGEKKAKYSRDLDGYRPYKIPTNEGEIILTVGGSTTDQKFIDDNKTWQAIIEKFGNMTVINGGVDGQSTYGHLLAIKNWHSKVFEKKMLIKLYFILV